MVQFVLPLATLLALTASQVAADLTKFDYEYDGRVVAIEWTKFTVEQLVDEQNDAWLSKEFNTTSTAIETSVEAGTATLAEFLQAMNDFYAVADTKFTNFGRAAGAKIAANGADMSVVNTVAPEAWSDYIFGHMYAIAKASGSAELQTMLETVQKQVEDGITKRITPKEVNEIVIPIYSKGNDIYPSFSKELTQKLEDFGLKLQDESEAVVLKQSTTAPAAATTTEATSAPSTSSSSTPAPAATSSASTTMMVSVVSMVALVAAFVW